MNYSSVFFVDSNWLAALRSRALAIVAAFIRHTRERVAEAIRTDLFSADLVEATCMCKFLGT